MEIKLVLFYLKLEWQEVEEEVLSLLERVGSIFDLKIEKKEIEKFGEEKLKDILWRISVRRKIKISQTRKAKSLHTHLVTFLDNEPFTFYPQGRRGREEITIKQFLEGLTEGKVLCLHKATELKNNLKL